MTEKKLKALLMELWLTIGASRIYRNERRSTNMIFANAHLHSGK